MRTFFLGFMLIGLIGSTTFAQSTDTTAAPPPERVESQPSKVFYGGNVGLSFGSYFRISVQPLVGYNLTPKLSGGVKLIYEYISDSRGAETRTWNNYGGSVFARYRLIPQIYAHTEFAYISYDFPELPGNLGGGRDGVPFLLLGGGYVQRISPNAGLFIEVLVDVLQDSKSPYEDWTPFISVGAAVGI